MKETSGQLNELVEHLFRQEAGKLVAILTKVFGIHNLQLAEDVVQDTLISALNHWSTTEVPKNPAAWITRVAKNKAINELKRQGNFKKQQDKIANHLQNQNEWIEKVFLDSEIKDSQLRMIFASCHPLLSTESQIALTLKTLGGFGVKEIANALFTNTATINKRLYRAKNKLREQNVDFEIPSGSDLFNRLDSVCLTLYLMFNEGYNPSNSNSVIRKELCLEALRLVILLTDEFEGSPKASALAALMCFHIARFEARIDDKGAIILFQDQNRDLWDVRFISRGIQFLNQSKDTDHLSEYHVEARIAAEHCMSPSFEETNWLDIYKQYEVLYEMKKNPVILLNLAIIKSQIFGFETSIEALVPLIEIEKLSRYYLLYACIGIFSMKLNRHAEAIKYLAEALSLTEAEHEKSFIQSRIEECEKLN